MIFPPVRGRKGLVREKDKTTAEINGLLPVQKVRLL